MKFELLSHDTLDLAIKDYIDSSFKPIFKFIRKNQYYYKTYRNRQELPNWLPEYRRYTICISVLNPLNRNILDVYYADEWLLKCNFTEHKETEVLVKAEYLTDEAIVAMLPYSGSTYEELDLPF